MPKPLLRAVGIHHLTDARYFAAQEIQWLGFPLDSANENYLDLTRARIIAEWIQGPTNVGEFELADVAQIQVILDNLGFSAVQLGAFSTAADAAALSSSFTVFKALVAHTVGEVVDWHIQCANFRPHVTAMVFDFARNGIKWSDLQQDLAAKNALEQLCNQYPICLHLPNEPIYLPEILKLPLYALDLSGGVEEQIGLKDFDALNDFFEAWEVYFDNDIEV